MVRINNGSVRSKRLLAHNNIFRRSSLGGFKLLSIGSLFVIGFVSFVYFSVSHRESGIQTGMASAHSANRIISTNRPFLIYGTAWKKEATADLVYRAINNGFRFIDTACQPKHYNEQGVGDGWKAAANELDLHRSDLFLQTKYTPFPGQDPNDVPYNKDDPLEKQVQTSLQVSLLNLQTDYLDSLVLHSPLQTIEDTMVVWRTMESFVDEGKVRNLGISNCYDPEFFRALYDMARIKPWALQNRFYSDSNFDVDLRAFLKSKNIKYQSFWTLTANRHALATDAAKQLAASKGLTPQTLLYAFLMQLGYFTPLDGTTNPQHMMEDIAVMERMEGGEKFFSEQELHDFANILGLPANEPF